MSDQHDEARRWLDLAESDLSDAENLVTGGRWRNACYLAQQAGEKAVKAVLAAHGLPFPRTHDIAVLVQLAPTDAVVRGTDADAPSLSAFAVEARYPLDVPAPTAEDARTAVADARKLVDAAKRDVLAGARE